MRLLAAVLVLACIVSAQEPPKVEPAKTEPEPAPVLHNTGKPLLLPFQCGDEDMQWAGMSCSRRSEKDS